MMPMCSALSVSAEHAPLWCVPGGLSSGCRMSNGVAINRGDGSACVWLVCVSGRGCGMAWRGVLEALASCMCESDGLRCLRTWSRCSVAVLGPGGDEVVLSWHGAQKLNKMV